MKKREKPLGMTDDEFDAILLQAIELESVLSVFELLLLIRVATCRQNVMGAAFPLTGMLMHNENASIVAAVYAPEETLMSLALQARLVRLGLLNYGENHQFTITPKGAVMASWWIDVLEDLGFRQEPSPIEPT